MSAHSDEYFREVIRELYNRVDELEQELEDALSLLESTKKELQEAKITLFSLNICLLLSHKKPTPSQNTKADDVLLVMSAKTE